MQRQTIAHSLLKSLKYKSLKHMNFTLLWNSPEDRVQCSFKQHKPCTTGRIAIEQ